MKSRLRNNILLFVLSAFSFFCYPLIRLLFSGSQRMQNFLASRGQGADLLPGKVSRRAVFYCSSAGEYEQARPIFARLASRGDEVVIIFFSLSGYNFAKSRGEQHYFIMAPLDSKFRVRQYLLSLDPDFVVVVRHEIWPVFVSLVSGVAPLWLANFSAPAPGLLKRFLYTPILSAFDHIFTVDQAAATWLLESGISGGQISIWGDSKFDSVAERAQLPHLKLRQSHGFANAVPNDSNLLILGSAWPRDIELVMEAFSKLPGSLSSKWRIVIAPHDVSKKMVHYVHDLIGRYGMSAVDFTNVDDLEVWSSEIVICVDAVGYLTDLYSYSSAAFVGGAMHHRVHNVLEPAVYGNQIAFGPLYSTSREAGLLVDKDLATVVTDVEECLAWLGALRLVRNANQPLVDLIKEYSGVADNFDELLSSGI